MIRKTLLTLAALLCGLAIQAKDYTVTSPSGTLSWTLATTPGLQYSLTVGDVRVMDGCSLSMTLSDGNIPGAEVRIRKVKRASCKETIEAAFYRQARFEAAYNSLSLSFKNGWILEARAYDDGVAWRWVCPDPKDRTVLDETVEYRFCEPYRMLVPYIKAGDRGPYITSFESQYTETKAGTPDERFAIMPLYVDLGAQGRLLLMEAEVYGYPGMFLKTTEDGFSAAFSPVPVHPNVQDGQYKAHIAETEGLDRLPWRILAYAADDCGLPVNNMVCQLAEPCRVEDLSWIRTGLSTWDWWNGIRRHGVDFKAGINTETYLYDIDFAARFGLPYILIDDGWYRNHDLFQPRKGLDLPRLCEYGREKGVGVLLWTSKGVLGLNPEKAFKHYSEMGVAGFKVDFFDAQDAPMTQRLYRYAELAARYRLVLDFHGVSKPVGLSRTFPNVLNYEGVVGLENAKWASAEELDLPRNDVMIPFIRQAAGPVDYTPGALRNATRKDYRPMGNKPMSQGTRAHQVAEYLVFDMPLAMLCDSPSDYLKEEETTTFITSLPTVFDHTRILQGKAGEYIVTAREKDGTWYIGGLTSWEKRDLTLDLDFLAGRTIRLFRDGTNSDKVGEDYVLEEFRLEGPLQIHLAPGGGFAAIIR